MSLRDPNSDPSKGPSLWRTARSIEAAAVAGIFAAAAWSYGLTRLLQGPGPTAPEDEIAAFFSRPDVGWDVMVVLQVLVLGTAGFLWFVGVIRSRIRADAARLFDTVFFGGGVLFAGLLFVGTAALAAPFVLVDRGRAELDPSTAALIRSFATVVLAVFAPRVAALFVFSLSTLAARTRVLPRWLVLLGYAVGLALLVNVTFFSPNVYVFPGWMALVSTVLLVRR
jgi:hypothetical protein